MYIKTVTITGSEPFTLSEMKNWLKVDDDITEDDDLITAMITEARSEVENYTGKTLIEKTVVEVFTGFGPKCIDLAAQPVKSITTLKYYDSDNSLQTWAAENYILTGTTTPARIFPAVGVNFPGTADRPDAVEITVVAGVLDIPEHLKKAMRFLIAKGYEKREDWIQEMKTAAQHLMDLEKVYWI